MSWVTWNADQSLTTSHTSAFCASRGSPLEIASALSYQGSSAAPTPWAKARLELRAIRRRYNLSNLLCAMGGLMALYVSFMLDSPKVRMEASTAPGANHC